MASQGNSYSAAPSPPHGRHLSHRERVEIREALSHLRAILAMAEEAGKTEALQLTGDDIYWLIKPAEEHIARLLEIDSTEDGR
jgi:hypothetical protein